MASDWIGVIAGLVAGALGSGLTGYFALRQTQKRVQSETPKVIADASAKVVETAQAIIGDLERRVAELEEKNRTQDKKISVQAGRITKLRKAVLELYNGSNVLVKQLIKLGEIPDWEPPEELLEVIQES